LVAVKGLGLKLLGGGLDKNDKDFYQVGSRRPAQFPYLVRPGGLVALGDRALNPHKNFFGAKQWIIFGKDFKCL
jgi:hypothetical protein